MTHWGLKCEFFLRCSKVEEGEGVYTYWPG